MAKYRSRNRARQPRSSPKNADSGRNKVDRRHRNMLIPTPHGTTPAVIRGSRQASQLGRYMSAVGQYLKTGNADALQEFEGHSIGGHRLITDPTTLNYLAESGSLQLDSIYALPESSS